MAGIARERETRGRRGIALNPTDARLTHSRSSAMLSRYLIAEMVLPSLYAMAAFGLLALVEQAAAKRFR